MKFTLPIACLLVKALLGCTDQTTDPSSPGSFYPLAVGNQWSYSVQWLDSSGAVLSTSQATTRIVDATTILSDPAFRFSTTNRFNLLMDSTYVWINRPDGVYVCDPREVLPAEQPKLWLTFKHPVCKGDFWNIAPVQWITGTWYSISTDSVITSSLGTHHCHVYQLKYYDTSIVYVVFVAPNIGIVRSDYYDIFSGKPWSRSILTGYQLN